MASSPCSSFVQALPSLLSTIFIILSASMTADTQSSGGGACPKACFCNAPSKIVYCSRRGLGRIPTSIPSDSLQLNLNGNIFEWPVIESSNFTGLEALEHLYLSECGIEKIKFGTFVELTNLKWLDLSNNRIKSVSEYGFSGLTLQHLFLNGNRHIQLVAESFEGLVTTGLYLHDCSLPRLQPDVLAPLNVSLKYLWLNGNELDRFDKRFSEIFSSLSHLRLSSNPLHCNCEVIWLKEFYDKNGDVFKGAVFPSCLTPHRLKGKYFNELSLFDFRCQAPMFSNIETSFGSTSGRLKCTASGDPAPTLYWIRPSGRTTKYSPPQDEEARLNEGILALKSGTASSSAVEGDGGDGGGFSGMYICIANNEAGNVTLTINVSWPLLSESGQYLSSSSISPGTSSPPQKINFIIPSATLPDVRAPSLATLDPRHPETSLPPHHVGYENRSYTVLNQVDVMLDKEVEAQRAPTQKLFTVTEFVCAVLGAHIGTLLLCIVIIPIVYRTRWRKRLMEKQRQQQLHHQLHYDIHGEPRLLLQQQQQQQLVAAAGTPSRNKLLLHQQYPAADTDSRSLDSVYLNGNSSQPRPHRQLYLTDYLLTPPPK